MIDLSHRLANERIQLLTQRRVHFLVLIPRLASLHPSADWSDRPPARTPISTAKTPAKRPGFAFSVSTFRGVGEDDLRALSPHFSVHIIAMAVKLLLKEAS